MNFGGETISIINDIDSTNYNYNLDFSIIFKKIKKIIFGEI